MSTEETPRVTPRVNSMERGATVIGVVVFAFCGIVTVLAWVGVLK